MNAPGAKVWEHTIETVLLLEIGAAAAAAVLPGMHVPAWSLPAIEVFAGAVTAFVFWSLTGSARFAYCALGLGTFLAAWTSWAVLAGFWQPAVIVTLIASMVTFIPLTALTAAHARDKRQEQLAGAGQAPKPDPDAAKAEEMAKFEHMFTELGQEGVQVTGLDVELAGRVVRLTLPRSGKVTIGDLQAVTGRIEVILRMKAGTIEFGHGGSSAEVFMRLRERDFLGSTIPLPSKYRASTVNKPFAVGIQEDGAVAMITVKGLHTRIIGVTDSGKSNLINVILAQLCGMVDTVVWVIDMKGGMVARPWLRPYAEGLAKVPAIDWVATTRAEAALMMHCFVQAIDYRMNTAHGSKITPSATKPQIVLICDEMADLFGALKGTRREVGEGATTNAQFIAMGETITQKARALAGSSVWATQRGTNSMSGSGDMKANCKQTIMLGTATEAEARWANADSRVAQKRSAALVDTKGAGTITMASKASLATKFFLLDHPPKPGSETGDSMCDDGCIPACPVYRTALETASVRPSLDRGTAGAMGEDYARRWERASTLLRRPAPEQEGSDTSRFDEIIAAGGFEDPEASLTEPQRRTLEILSARGVQGASPNLLLMELEKEGLAPVRETLQRWLKKFEQDGLVHSASFGRWKIGPKKESSAA